VHGNLVGRDFARLGLAKGFTQKRFTEVAGFIQRYAVVSSGADASTEVTHIISQALGVRHIEAIIPDKKPRTKRSPPERKNRTTSSSSRRRRLLQIRWWDLGRRFR
jgi:hypothetical protein